MFLKKLIKRIETLEKSVNWLLRHELLGATIDDAPECVKEIRSDHL